MFHLWYFGVLWLSLQYLRGIYTSHGRQCYQNCFFFFFNSEKGFTRKGKEQIFSFQKRPFLKKGFLCRKSNRKSKQLSPLFRMAADLTSESISLKILWVSVCSCIHLYSLSFQRSYMYSYQLKKCLGGWGVSAPNLGHEVQGSNPTRDRIQPMTYSTSFHRAFHGHPHIVSIWLKFCWKVCKTPNHNHPTYSTWTAVLPFMDVHFLV